MTSDMDFFLSTNQIKLLIRLANSFVSSPPEEKRTAKSEEKLILRDQPVSDSGVESDASTITNINDPRLQTQGASDTEDVPRTRNMIPFDVLLTAGRISCVLYSHVIDRGNWKKKERMKTESRVTKSDLEWKGDAKHSAPFHDISHDDASGYEADTEYAVQTEECSNFTFMNIHESGSPKASGDPVQSDGGVLIEPFLFFYVSQPHTVLSYLPHSQKFEMSCYDIMIKGTSTDYYAAGKHKYTTEFIILNICGLVGTMLKGTSTDYYVAGKHKYDI